MAQKTTAELTQEAQQIRNETKIGANTAVRVGDMLIDIIDSKVNTIPAPIVSIQKADQNYISVQFRDTNFLVGAINPELFLFRWRNKRHSKYLRAGNVIRRVKAAGWVHPTDYVNGYAKYQGWKYFCGSQKAKFNQDAENRQTEWAIPNVWIPMDKFTIAVNRFMHFTETNQITGAVAYDANFFTTNHYLHNSSQNTSNANLYISLGGNQRAKYFLNPKWGKNKKYCLAVAVDNPEATKTNGLCPKIFGLMSEPFYAAGQYNKGKISDIIFVKSESAQHLKIRK